MEGVLFTFSTLFNKKTIYKTRKGQVQLNLSQKYYPAENQQSNTTNIKMFTHTDLDGVGCVVVARILGLGNLHVEYCDYTNINQAVVDFIQSKDGEKCDKAYITDISVTPEVAELIESVNNNPNTKLKFMLYDHHKTAKWMPVKHSWATVSEELDGRLCCGTKLFYKMMVAGGLDMGNPMVHHNLEWFVERVNNYDTWLWEGENDKLAKEMCDYMFLIGRNRFLDKAERKLLNLQLPSEPFFDVVDRFMLEVERERIAAFLVRKAKNVVERQIDGLTAGIVFAEQYTSELGNKINKDNPHLDFTLVINPSNKGYSYYSIKEDIDLGQLASKVGGGGHPKASGSSMTEALFNEIVETCLKQFYNLQN